MSDAPTPLGFARLAVDVLTGLAVVGTLFSYLPYVVALIGAVYYCLQIWEMPSVRSARTGWRNKRRVRRLLRLHKKIERAQNAMQLAQAALEQFNKAQIVTGAVPSTEELKNGPTSR